MLKKMAASSGNTFDLEQIMKDAELIDLPVNTWEEFVIAASSIAEAHAFKRTMIVDDQVVSLERSRNKLTDLFV